MKKIPLIRCVVLAGLALSAADLCQGASQPWTDGGVTWSDGDGTPTYYNPDANEDADLYDKLPTGLGTLPKWTDFSVSGDVSNADIVANYLQISTDTLSTNAYTATAGLDFDHLTFETRFRIDSINSPYYGGMLLLAGAGKGLSLAFKQNTIEQFGNILVGGLDLSEWTVLRVTITGGASPTVNLYINNGLDPVYTSSSIFFDTPTVGLVFGDASSTAEGGVSQWDYLRWTNTGAFAPQPVPEPQGIALLAMGGGLLALGYRLRDRRRASGVIATE